MEEAPAPGGRRKAAVLLVSIFIIAGCGILYELLVSVVSTYFLGSSVLHFSITIGLFMSFMGLGSYLSRFIRRDLLDAFVWIELALGVAGGASALILHFSHALAQNYYLVAFLLIGVLGSLIGVEIPLLTRILRQYAPLRDAVARALSFDYLGALAASVLFPIILLPYLGVMRTAFAAGLLNVLVALANARLFRGELRQARAQMLAAGLAMLLMLAGIAYSVKLTGFFEQFLYKDEILLARQTPYQRVVVTKWKNDLRLYLNGGLQFSSLDEHRYHEPLVHVPAAWQGGPRRALLLGAGDGLAARELLKYPAMKSVTLVDLDPEITRLARQNVFFVRLNNNSLADPRVRVFHQDAFNFVEADDGLYDLIIVDLPDPKDVGLAKLYTREFYAMAKKRLAAGGVLVTQATSPYFAPKAFWCIKETVESAFGHAAPYHAWVPSFGEWGFVMAKKAPSRGPRAEAPMENEGAGKAAPPPSPEKLRSLLSRRLFAEKAPTFRYLNEAELPALFRFDGDMKARPANVNTLDGQPLVDYYTQSWRQWN